MTGHLARAGAPRPRIAVFAGPTATILNTPDPVTSNKARTRHGLPPQPARFDALRPQRLAAPVTVYVEAFTAHPLEQDAAHLYAAPDGWLDTDGVLHTEPPAGNATPVYAVERFGLADHGTGVELWSAAVDFAGKSVVDVGGGGGHLLATVLGATPDARGTLFDREHMMPKASEHLAAAVGLDRVDLVAGDMFTEVPKGGDVYILCRVLAGWDDEAVVRAFGNCRRAMADTSSRLLILDRFVADGNPTVLPALWDLHLLMTTGGEHRTIDRVTALLDRAGLDVERTADLPMETVALVAAPRPADRP